MQFLGSEKADFLLESREWPKTSFDQAVSSERLIVSIASITVSGVISIVDRGIVKIISLISKLGEEEAKILYLPKIDSMVSDVAKKVLFSGTFWISIAKYSLTFCWAFWIQGEREKSSVTFNQYCWEFWGIPCWINCFLARSKTF